MHYPVLLETELASRWKISVAALRAWRQRNIGPRWHKLLRKHVRYHVADILEFEATALPQWLALQAVQEQPRRAGKSGIVAALDASDPPPDFVDAKTVVAFSKLPYHYIADRQMRERLQIPHMTVVRVVRYSLLAVWRWELERSRVGGTEDRVIELAPEEPEPPPAKALRWYEITPAKAETQADAGKLEIACD